MKRRAKDHEFIVWDGHVYQRVGTRDEAGVGSIPEPSDYVAVKTVRHGGRTYEPGDRLPKTPYLPANGYTSIPVRFAVIPGFDRLVEQGLARREPREEAK